MAMNPFTEGFRIQVVEAIITKRVADTNQLVDNVILDWEDNTRKFVVEQQRKSSLYESKYLEQVLYQKLSAVGYKLFVYCLYNLARDSDIITLQHKKVNKKMEFSRTSLYRAIGNLIEASVITPKSKSDYWVNPNYLFKGNRVKYYRSINADIIEVVYQRKLTDEINFKAKAE